MSFFGFFAAFLCELCGKGLTAVRQGFSQCGKKSDKASTLFAVIRPYSQHGISIARNPERGRVDTALTTALSSPATEKAEEISADGFDEIMRQHQRRVYRVIYLLVRDADTAQ